MAGPAHSSSSSIKPAFGSFFQKIAQMKEFQTCSPRNTEILQQLESIQGAGGRRATDIEAICSRITSEVCIAS